MNIHLVQIACLQCGTIDESGMEISGPHVKSQCQYCCTYVKFISPKELPGVLEVRAAIWRISNGDQRLINSCKTLSHFNIATPGMGLLEVFIQYWKLYLKIRQVVINATN